MQKSKKLLSALLALVMVLTAFPLVALATTYKDRPADDTTTGQPFVVNKPSQYYRIPAMVTLADGTIVAAADTRWNNTKDGGGNDVIVTRSTNNGKTWSYHMVNYFGDNGDQYNSSSTSFCDSEIATDGNKVYLLSTFFPAGRALNSADAQPTTEKAFDDQGRLLLKADGSSSYEYYLDINTKQDGRYTIRKISDNSIVSDATVDEEFYLCKYNGERNGSIFFNDSAYQTAKTQFLWFRSSDDGGVTWNAPKLLNLKNSGEKFLGVGPGRGLVTSNGDIVFTTYTTTGTASSQRTYLVWSNDGGNTWQRTSGNATNDAWWSSEATPIELPDGTVRVYLRSDGKQLVQSDAVRSADGTWTWKNNAGIVKDADGSSNIPAWTDCQESALMYPYKINGQDAILIACPTNTSSSRKNGTIHLLLVDENYNCTKRLTYAVTDVNTDYQYSSMDVLANGNIGLIYESNGAVIYKEIAIKDIASGVDVAIPEIRNVTLEIGGSYTLKADTNTFTDYDSDVLELTSTGIPTAKLQLGTDNSYSGDKVSIKNALYHFTAQSDGYMIKSSSNTSLYLDPYSSAGPGYPHKSEATYCVFEQASGSSDTSLLNLRSTSAYSNGNYPYLVFAKGTGVNNVFDRWGGSLSVADATSNNSGLGCTPQEAAKLSLFRPVEAGETSSAEIPGYVKVSNMSGIVTGKDYIVAFKANNGSYYVTYPSTSTSNKFTHVAKVLSNETETASYNVTVVGAKAGTTILKVSDNLSYRITVSSTISVTGAVRYDPVIYTQGSSFTLYGTDIAYDESAGEIPNNYLLADGYTIQSIEVVEGAVSSNIEPSDKSANGYLTGSIDVGNNYSTECWQEVTLKTILKDSEGQEYSQFNKVFVATSPVPAHGVTNAQVWRGSISGTYQCFCPISTIAKGSVSSYTGTEGLHYTFQGKNDSGGVLRAVNVINMYTPAGFTVKPDDADVSNIYTTDGKVGGTYAYGSDGNSAISYSYTTTMIATTQTGHYYYDKSASKNQGFKTSNGKNFELEFVVNRGSISTSGNKVVDTSIDLDINDISVTLAGKTTTFRNNENSAYDNDTYFKDIAFNSMTNALQTITYSGSTDDASNGVISGSIHTKISNAAFHEKGWAVSDTTVPIQIHVFDKSAVRAPYERAVTNNGKVDNDVLKASDFTKTSWAAYEKAMLDIEAYVANIKSGETNQELGSKLTEKYNALERLADFSALEEQIDAKQNLYGKEFPLDENGNQQYTVSTWNTFQTYYGAGLRLTTQVYPAGDSRVDLAGWNPNGTEGPHSTTRTDVQISIDDLEEKIRLNPEAPADDSAYIAAKELSETIDLDAYKLAQNIADAKKTGDAAIYVEYPADSGKMYVDIPISKQTTDLDPHTTHLLNTMNVATENKLVTGDGASNKGRLSTVIFQKNGVQTWSGTYGYGTELAFTIVPAGNNSPGATQVTAEQAKNLTVLVTNENSTTKIPLTSDNKVKFVAQGTTITVNLITSTSPNVIVRDYFGTILYSGSAERDQIVMDDSGATVTVNGTVVKAKPSPAFKFKSWELTYEDDGSICVIQKGVRVSDEDGVHYFEATNGIVTRYNTTEPVTSFNAYGIPYTVTPNEGVTPIVWKMTVDGKDYLAAYESSFTRYAYNYNTVYTAITSEDELGDLASAYGKPVSYGNAFISGDKNDKLTLACSYSAAPGTTIAEAGVLYSTNGDLTSETMTKGAAGVSTKIQTRVSEFGTYTMTKTNALEGTHLMRSYVSYTENVGGTTVIRVSYGPVYQCVNGQISIVE